MTNYNHISKNRFDAEVTQWSKNDSKKDIISWEREMRLKILIKEIKKRKEETIKILEIGCGSGSNLKALRKISPKWKLYGVDISPKMISYTKKNVKGVKSKVLNIDSKHLNETFDIIFLLGVVGYVQNTKETFKNIQKMLNPKGILFFTYGNKESKYRKRKKIMNNLIDKNKLFLKCYNFLKIQILGNKQPYNPTANKFKLYTYNQIKGLLKDFTIKKTYSICHSAGFFGTLSTKIGQKREKEMILKKLPNQGMTNIISLIYSKK